MNWVTTYWVLFAAVFSPYCLALDMKIQSIRLLSGTIHEVIYSSTTFPAIAHVIKIPLDGVAIKLVPAIGQRECVSSIAKRAKAFIAVNGANYRRGGNYNGNRVNLFYLNNKVYADLQFVRGSFGWHSKKRIAVIDTTFLDINFTINGIKFPVTAINQPRIIGQAVLYTDVADTALLAYTPGPIITISSEMVVTDIGDKVPPYLPQGWLAYQIDTCPDSIKVGMSCTADFNIRSATKPDVVYNSYDFVMGGAGLLIQNGLCTAEQLYQEFGQGAAIVRCGDEIAADFHSRDMQEWLIELRHPRTAIGLTEHHEICIVVVDGRQKHSEGLSLKELALFMQQLGCINALNIGGGGCTTLCINDQLVSSPSASFEKPIAGEERPVSEALCFFIQ